MEQMMFLPVDLAHDDEDFVTDPSGNISITDDAEGRLYISTGDHTVGINLPDLMQFITNAMLQRVME